MGKNNLLKYSVEALLHEANPRGEPYFRKTYFYKSLFLLHKNLKKKDIDLELPYCWYRHGPLIEPISFEEKAGIKLEKYINNNYTVPINNVRCEGVADSEKKIILDEIHSLLRNYRTGHTWNEDYGDQLVGDSYSRAPYRYQVTFKRNYIPFCINLEKELWSIQSAFEKISKNMVQYLDKLIKEFPEKDMIEILDDYLFWDEITRLKIQNAEPVDVIYNWSVTYWNFFSLILRIRQNENILLPIIENWETEFIIAQSHFSKDLDSIQKDSFKIMNQNKKQTIDPNIDKIVRNLMGYARDSTTQIHEEM